MANRVTTPLPRGTVTFLFSDVEGSTGLLRRLGRERYGELLEEHDRLVRGVLEANGGIEIDRQGDACFAVFASAEAAVAAAAALQRAVAGYAWPEGERVRVRLGLHTGEAAVRGRRYVGVAVHRAARIGDLGHGGQVLLSRTTAAIVESELVEGLRLVDLGSTSLEGLERPEHVFQLVVAGLEEEFPRLRTRPAPTAATPEAAGLLERHAELETIHAHVDAAATGEGRLVVIEGRAGMGKTRLVGEARTLAAASGLVVLSARGGELEHEFAFGIVRQLFEPLLAAASAQERSELLDGPAAGAAAVFGAAEAAADDAGEDATAVSFATLHALYWLAANQALRKPTVLLVDDLHWSDAPSLRFLVHAQRRLEGVPLLVLVATRPPEQSREPALVTEIVSEPAAAVVRPSALSPEAVATLATDVFGREPDETFVEACREATGGNPLFVRALLDTLRSEGVAPTAAEAGRVHEIGPEPVGRAVTLRLSRLPSEATELARAVAVLGNGVALHVAAELAGLEREQAVHAATTLARADLLRLDLPLEFTHPVVRASVYEAIDPAARIEAHRRAAAQLARTGAEPETVASHLEHVLPSGDPFVVSALQQAAERSLARGASDVAVSFLRRALAEPPQPDERVDVLRSLGLAERLLDTDAAVEHLSESIGLGPDPAHCARISLELGRTLQRANRHQEAIRYLRDGLEYAGDVDMSQSLAAELVSASWWEPETLPIAEEELALLDESTLVDGYGGDLLRAVLAYGEARRGHDRERTLELAGAAVASGRIEQTGSRALYQAGYALTVAGRPDLAVAAYERGFLEGLRRGDGVLAGGCLLFRALSHLHRGELAAAEEALADISVHAEFAMMRPYRAAFEAWIALERADYTGAERALAAAGLPDRLPANAHLMLFHLVRGRTRLHRLGPEAGIADLSALGEIAELLHMRNPAFLPWRPYAALALHAAGRVDEARALAREALELAREWGADRMLGVTLRTLGLVEGGKEGLRLLEEAVETLAGSQARLEHAKALVELGAALRRANRRADARDHLREGLDLAHRVGAGALRERAKIELAATGARPRRLTLSGLDALTPSERRVAELAAGDLTNKAIAQALFVTPKTVEVHLSSAYRKLGISSRTQLGEAIAGA